MILALGAIVGSIIGTALGVLFAVGLGLYAQMAAPDDPTAFSVATIVAGTAPGGFLVGIALGITCASIVADQNDKRKLAAPKKRQWTADHSNNQNV